MNQRCRVGAHARNQHCPVLTVQKIDMQNNECTNKGPMDDDDFPEFGVAVVDCLTRHLQPEQRCASCNAARERAYRQAVDAFASKMLRELIANDGKGDFLDWNPHWTEALGEINIHVKRLQEKISDAPGLHKADDKKRVSELCADIANFLMKMETGYGYGEKHAEEEHVVDRSLAAYNRKTNTTGTCKKCGSPTFGLLCAKCKGKA
jgi:hypothetical protein